MKKRTAAFGYLPVPAEVDMNAPAATIVEVTCFISASELETEIARLRALEAAAGRHLTAAEIMADPS